MAYIYPFRMASGTATILVIDRNYANPKKSRLLIGIRGRKVAVHPGKPSMPGGFMEAKLSQDQLDWMSPILAVMQGAASKLHAFINHFWPEVHPGETLEEAAIRELLEEVQVEFSEDQLVQYYTCSDPGLDPRAHVINLCLYAVATPEQIAAVEAGDDLEAVDWWDFDKVETYDGDIAFNHRDLMLRGIKAFLRDVRFEEMEAQNG